MEITEKDLEILKTIIQEYTTRKFSFIGLQEFFPEILQDIQQKLNTVVKISIKLQSDIKLKNLKNHDSIQDKGDDPYCYIQQNK